MGVCVRSSEIGCACMETGCANIVSLLLLYVGSLLTATIKKSICPHMTSYSNTEIVVSYPVMIATNVVTD